MKTDLQKIPWEETIKTAVEEVAFRTPSCYVKFVFDKPEPLKGPSIEIPKKKDDIEFFGIFGLEKLMEVFGEIFSKGSFYIVYVDSRQNIYGTVPSEKYDFFLETIHKTLSYEKEREEEELFDIFQKAKGLFFEGSSLPLKKEAEHKADIEKYCETMVQKHNEKVLLFTFREELNRAIEKYRRGYDSFRNYEIIYVKYLTLKILGDGDLQ